MQAVDSASFFRMLAFARQSLGKNIDTINGLNVFPAPDGDTGSNMYKTTEGAVAAAAEKADIGACAAAIGDGMLRSARGNSGVILSIFFRGVAKGLAGLHSASAGDLSAAFAEGVKSAYGAVMNPTEGTILTVMRSAAEAVADIDPDADLEDFFDKMIAAADVALAHTKEQLQVLRDAGVVDAGGYGFTLMLHAMRAGLTAEDDAITFDASKDVVQMEAVLSAAALSDAEITYPYCTECIVDKSPEYIKDGAASSFREFAYGIGDSVVFVDEGGIIKIHVHTSDPGAVLTEAIRYGSLAAVKIENMRNQHTSLSDIGEKHTPVYEQAYGIVAVADGEGICAALCDLGADVIIEGGQTMNPSTEQLFEGAKSISAETIYFLPNNSNIILVAEQAVKLLADIGRHAVVIPTRSVPQGISALYAFDPDGTSEDNETAMAEATRTVKTLSVTRAVRDADIDGMHIVCGDWLGLSENKICVSSKTLEECMKALAPKLHGSDCVTVFYGEGADEEDAEHFGEAITAALGDDIDLTVLPGGQSAYSFIVSGE